MKIKSITLENVKSFRDKITIEFDKNFNILIGPNAGGKSNLLDIITVVIRHFLVKDFSIIESHDQHGLLSIDILFRQFFNPIEKHLEKYIGNENNTSSIEIIFEVTEEDIKNIEEIVSKKEILKRNLRRYRNGNNFVETVNPACQSLEECHLSVGMELRYTIQDCQLNSHNNKEKAYLQYLNNFELFRILSNEEIDLKPVYLYFSPYRLMNVSNIQVNLSDQSFYQLYQKYAESTSKSTCSLMKLASLYFSQKRRKLEIDAKDEGYYNRWKEDEEVKLVTNYLNKLGYDWDIKLINPNKNIYELLLINNGRYFSITQASSGEKEIINFLLGIFAFSIRNGLIVIDEPELHLHPKWQTVLMDLFIELSTQTDNQFIISTHSPIFINDKTISNVIRIYKDDTGTSRAVKIKGTSLPEARHLLHIINSHNNEKLFFADKVVLVEGITDRLVFEKLIRFYQSENNKPQIVEVLEVHGKHNFNEYKKVLKEIGCKYYIIADLDYVRELASKDGNEKIKKLFEIDYSSIDKTITDKKSRDGKKLAELIERAVNMDRITRELKDAWNYIKMRHLKLRDNLTEEEIKELNEYIQQKERESIFILCSGEKLKYKEIEDFLPEGYKSLDGIIKLTKPSEFEKWLENDAEQEKRKYLQGIVCKILNLPNA